MVSSYLLQSGGMLADRGEGSLEDGREEGAQEGDQSELKQGCREGPGGQCVLRGGDSKRQSLKGTLRAELWARGVEGMGSHWERVARARCRGLERVPWTPRLRTMAGEGMEHG